MPSALKRIKSALSNNKQLSKSDIFELAELKNNKSNNALFDFLLEKKQILYSGLGRGRRYFLPKPIFIIPKNGSYKFSQTGNSIITFEYKEELEEVRMVTLDSYEAFVQFINKELCNDGRI